MNWLDFCLSNLSNHRPVILACVNHCPPPMLLPLGPNWACTATEETDSSIPGRPAHFIRQAAQKLLKENHKTEGVVIPLNPWAGANSKHNLSLKLRKIDTDELHDLTILNQKLNSGQACILNLTTLKITDLPRYNSPITVQAMSCTDNTITFKPSKTHIALFGAGALAHQIAHFLSDSPHTIHWEAPANERFPQRHAANLLLREPQSEKLGWLASNTHSLVMTHDHALDFRLCTELAQSPQVRSVGVVGSKRKGEQLRHFLMEQDLTKQQIKKIRCPIGGGNTENLVAAAIAIAHETMQIANRGLPVRP